MPLDIELLAQRRGAITVLVAEEISRLGVEAFVTTRDGGVSHGPYASLNLALHVGDDQQAVREESRRLADAL